MKYKSVKRLRLTPHTDQVRIDLYQEVIHTLRTEVWRGVMRPVWNTTFGFFLTDMIHTDMIHHETKRTNRKTTRSS